MEITKREIVSSITIIAVMLLVGFLIGSKISDSELDNNEKNNKALKIESADLFQYGMNTNVGNAFVYGDLEAIDTVSYPEVNGEFLYIEKVKERYTLHTRVVRSGKTTTVQTYWKWDKVGSESKHSKNIKFLGVEFDYNKIKRPKSNYIDTVKESSHIRYKFYACKAKYRGTIFTELKNGTISDKSDFYRDMTINETVKHLEVRSGTIIFWIFWIGLIVGAVYGFYYLDNNWLNR
ncbi:MAG: hypothetical protein E6600_04370 [Anaerocolumna aminovalerica]|uniref:hypothetical protein n=1 Tax=Anaerocolumna aminovalerica TaxID=1527 RepID=UPI00290FE988|nr:hypothetical protein [Anaerocolumna aminovalerica]MDU6263721.1 hypothetical protein [Anaerocolumna aminovalerica]